MAQFDVHRNSGSMQASIPYVVIVQSGQFDISNRRIVVPLALKKLSSAGARKSKSRLNPEFVIERQTVMFHPLEMATVPVSKLGAYVTSLHGDGLAISDALDELFTRTWG